VCDAAAGFGVYHGQLNFRGGDNIVSKATIEKYPSPTPGAAQRDTLPIAIGITEFHFLLLFPTKLMALSKVTGAVMFEQGLPERVGELRGMVIDSNPPDDLYPLIWVFSSRCVRVCPLPQ
jgi:hypothetical protein